MNLVALEDAKVGDEGQVAVDATEDGVVDHVEASGKDEAVILALKRRIRGKGGGQGSGGSILRGGET